MIDRLHRHEQGIIPVQCPVTFSLAATGRARRFIERHPLTVIALLAGGGLALVTAVGVLLWP